MSIPAPSFSPEHIHPILVNFTAALLPASFGSDILGRIFRRESLHNAAWWMLIYAACITPLTAIAGALWKKALDEAALPHSVIVTHQWLGISLAVAFLGLAIWRWKIYSLNAAPGLRYLLFTFVVVLVLAYQGSLGGHMVLG